MCTDVVTQISQMIFYFDCELNLVFYMEYAVECCFELAGSTHRGMTDVLNIRKATFQPLF